MKIKNRFICLIIFALCIFLFGIMPDKVMASETASVVTIEEINYEDAYILINPQGNTKVYYSQANKNTWYEVEGVKKNGKFVLDISWISEKSDYSLSLKGSENENVITTTLPAMNSKLKVSYSTVEGELMFQNEEGANDFEWKKSTSNIWYTGKIGSYESSFQKAIEELMILGGKITIRIPQTIGKSATETGSRPSKQITISIAKRAMAPSVKVNITNLTLNTTEAMEYQIYSINGVIQKNQKWISCEKSMEISEIVPKGILDSTVVVAIRKAATERASYSKTAYVTIPVQAAAPTEILKTITSTKYTISFPEASKTNPYQYAIVKPGADDSRLSWKTVTSTKGISYTEKTLPEGSTIYVRLRGYAETKTEPLKLPSKITTFVVKYTK